MSTTYETEYLQQVSTLLHVLFEAGVACYYDGPKETLSLDRLRIPLRPALRAWRVTHGDQRYIEAALQDAGDAWRVEHPGQYPTLCVDLHYCWAHVLHHARCPEAVQWQLWHNTVLMALMRHGCYAPERNHEPLPGQELDAAETKGRLDDAFAACFPGFDRLPRYRQVVDDDGSTHMERINPENEEEEDDE